MTVINPAMSQQRGKVFDKQLEMHAITEPALSASGRTTPINFPAIDVDLAKVIINHEAYSGFTAGVNFWAATVEISNSAGVTFVAAYKVNLPATKGTIEIPISGLTNYRILNDAAQIRVFLEKTGTAGDLTLGVYLTSK